jgi:hypothetical protein
MICTIEKIIEMAKKIAQDNPRFAMPPQNLYIALAGLALMILGYILMTGGGTDDPNIFTGEQMFSFRRIVLSPLLIIAGFVVEIVAIMKKPRR